MYPGSSVWKPKPCENRSLKVVFHMIVTIVELELKSINWCKTISNWWRLLSLERLSETNCFEF